MNDTELDLERPFFGGDMLLLTVLPHICMPCFGSTKLGKMSILTLGVP